jgi:hypothetical protein
MRIVVYTAIFGDIDNLWSVCPTSYSDDVEYVCFTGKERRQVGLWGGSTKRPKMMDSSLDAPAVWEQRIIAGWEKWGSARRTARRIKALPHHYMPDAHVWIWVDGNVRLLVQPSMLTDRWLGNGLAIFKHPDRTCLYQEAAFCAKVGKDSTSVLNKQVSKYRKAGMPQNYGLPETRCIIRRNTRQNREIGEKWWQELEQHSVRDQVSIPYVCWVLGAKWDVIPGRCYSANTSDHFWYKKHGGK